MDEGDFVTWLNGCIVTWEADQTADKQEKPRIASRLYGGSANDGLTQNTFSFGEENPLEIHFECLGVGRFQ